MGMYVKIGPNGCLSTHRVARCVDFDLKYIDYKKNRIPFPLNENILRCKVREPKKFEVNFARITSYMKSTIPYC